MFPSKLPLLLLVFFLVGTAVTYVQAKPIDDYDYPINSIDNEISDDELIPGKKDIVDDEEVEEGEAEERNVLNELDSEIEGDAAKEEEEEDKKNEYDEEEFEEEIADAEEEELGKEDEEEKAIAEEEEAAEDKDNEIAEEEEAAEDKDNEIAEEEDVPEEDKKKFPYSWYDKVKKFFKG